MKTTLLNLLGTSKMILDTIRSNGRVTLSMRTHEISLGDHPAIGIWSDQKDMMDTSSFVNELRKGRFLRKDYCL